MKRFTVKNGCALLALIVLAAPAFAADTASEGNFFSDAWRQVTDTVSPSDSPSAAKTSPEAEQSITIKDGAVGVEAANVATQATIGSDDTVVLQTDDGHSAAPSVDAELVEKTEAAPEKKADAPAAKESSMWDDMLDSVGLGEDKEAAK